MTEESISKTILNHIDKPIFKLVGEAAASIGQSCHVVGGFVRDILLGRENKDLDFTTVGSGADLANAVASRLGKKCHVKIFKSFGTAQVHSGKLDLEFVGARRESYRAGSRKPLVENGTFEEDLARRDFTVNAMAISLTPDSFGELIDLFNGKEDLENRIIRTPLEPDRTFSEDPLRILRAIRFATQLGFDIHPDTFESIKRNAATVLTLSGERIAEELNKMMMTPRPSVGWWLMHNSGVLNVLMPEIEALYGVDIVNGRAHKENFDHTMQVLDKVASNGGHLWLRWAALLHDIAKPRTKKWDNTHGWTFHNHNFIGARMIKPMFKRLKLPLNADLKYVEKIVELHMRPVALVEDTVTDSALRRLATDCGDQTTLDDLMVLCEADVTSKNPKKVQRCLENLALVRQKIDELKARDEVKNYLPPVNGLVIKRVFGIGDGPEIKNVTTALKNAYLDGIISRDYDENFDYMLNVVAPQLNMSPVDTTRHSDSDVKKKNNQESNN